MIEGGIPVIHVVGKTLPEAWEKALVEVWEKGAAIRTSYDRKDDTGEYIDPPSRDATGIIVRENPLEEPMIHKNIPGGPEELEIYLQEALEGIHDHWVDVADPDKWDYSYHERLFRYQPRSRDGKPFVAKIHTDQVQLMINNLIKEPWNRRVQATTWIPTFDPHLSHPPCLQRVWARLSKASEGYVLNLNVHWRSRDAYKAWMMNMWFLCGFAKHMADRISEGLGEPVMVGRMVDISDSLHIYGSYFEEFEKEYKKIKENPEGWKDRAWDSTDPILVEMFEEVREKLRRNVDFQKHTDMPSNAR
jgi:thymidylate synthase